MISLRAAPGATVEEVAATLGSSAAGLPAAAAASRLDEVGPNAVRTHHARPVAVLVRQVRSPLLLFVVTATVRRDGTW
jgi:Mg2+-importing ATPase